MIWMIYPIPKASIHLKIWGCPVSPLILLSPPPPFPSLPLLSCPFPFPFPSPPSFPLPQAVPPLNQLGCLGSTVSSPVGSGAKPQPTNDLAHIWAKRSSSVLCIFLYRHHRPILPFSYCVWKRLNWISHFFTTSMSMHQSVGLWPLPGSATVILVI